ncbi:MAG: carboxypeptidase-like regulatory domain-containing protein [Bryobacteraceae bacterium]
MLASLALFFSFAVWPQEPTGEIVGTVLDQTGATVTGAAVAITNLSTGVTRSLTSNSSGVYTAPALPPGTYSVRVTKTGFTSSVRSNVEVAVGQEVRQDFSLQVGDVNQSVEVSAVATALDTETTTVGTVIGIRSIEDLPLNGRNYLQLADLVPSGTMYGPSNYIAQARGGGDRSQFQLNLAGQRFQYVHYTLDGIENTDFNYGTYLVLPSVDAIQEFNVETGTYSAEFGHNVTQMNVVSKSGSNQYHGAAFEFVRNTDMDAKNFFQQPHTPIEILKRNQFGFVLGGPVQIPHVFSGHDKLFFLVNYEGQRQNQQNLAYGSVPLPSYFTGNFAGYSTVIYDPSQRVLNAAGTAVVSQAPFPGNVIPSSRIAPQSALAASLFPAPNATPTNVLNYVYANNYVDNTELITDNHDEELARVDYQANQQVSFQFRYSHGNEPSYTPESSSVFAGMGTVNSAITHQAMLGNVWAISPTKVNEFKLGMSRLESINGNLHTGNPNFNWVGKLGIPDVLDTPAFWGIPLLTISNFSSPGDPQNGPYSSWDTTIEATDNFSWNLGKHSIKFGADFERIRFNMTGDDYARGGFSYTGEYTSLVGASPLPLNSMADYLLGDIATSQGQLGLVADQLRDWALGPYIHDQWKVNQKLTINIGLRYELQPGLNEKYDHMTNISWAWNDLFGPTWVRAGSGDFYAGSPPYPLPAGIPFARGEYGNTTWKTDYHQFGPRAGLAYNLNAKTVIRAGFGIYYPHDVGNTAFDITRNQPFTERISSTSNTFIPNANWSTPFPVISLSTLAPSWVWGDPLPYTPQWSVNVQRSLNNTTTLEVGYVGSAGIHLQRTVYYNDSPPAAPVANRNLLRPFPYGGIMGFVQAVESASHSNYDSLQARLQHHFAHGFTLLSSFSYEKSIDNGSGIRQANGDEYVPPNGANLAAERGLSAFNFGKKWTTSGLYSLPFGRGQHMLAQANRIVDAFIGGWQLGGILTFEGGFPFSMACTNSSYQNTDGTCRPDATGISPVLPNPSPNDWFNQAAFVNRLNFVPNVGPYRFGNDGRDNLVGPGLADLDASLAKSFSITERVHLDFRGELFNLPNHPILGQPGSTVGVASEGEITSTRVPSRQIQLALKLRF